MQLNKKYSTALISLFIISLILTDTNCSDQVSTSNSFNTGMLFGQVFNLSHPGPIPIGWIPPPLESVTTIIVMDAKKKIIKEVSTDEKGKFVIMLSQGIYYLQVKDSPIPVETGPYVLIEGQTTLGEAYFDVGMK